MLHRVLIALFITGLLLSACIPQAGPAPLPTGASSGVPTLAPLPVQPVVTQESTATLAVESTASGSGNAAGGGRGTETPVTTAPTATTSAQSATPTAPAAAGTSNAATASPSPEPAGSLPPGGTIPYLDDRSSPEALIRSYANALDRREYSRAYGYWSAGAAASGLAPFDQFAAGFADTATVSVEIRDTSGGVAAGSESYVVAATLLAKTLSGPQQTYLACYTLHLPAPAGQDVPFQPLSIDSAALKQVANNSDTVGQLKAFCLTGPPPAVTPSPAGPDDISPRLYIDDRSGPVEVLRSLFNAINRREYARAFSYWRATSDSSGAPTDYAQFKAGYAETESVGLKTGTPQVGAAAGNIYYQVPVALTARTTAGVTQAFAGCYTLHLSQPGLQAMLVPFQPMAIESAQVHQVAGAAAAEAELGTVCRMGQ